MKKIAIIGSHGLFANYGGFDQLVNNIVKYSDKRDLIYITQPRSTEIPTNIPRNVLISKSYFDAPGVEGMFFDSICILRYYFKVDSILLLGAGALPLIIFLSIFKKKKIIVNNGGIEWERQKFSKVARIYHKFIFNLSAKYADILILDNQTFKDHLPSKYSAKLSMIPYGGSISNKLVEKKDLFIKKYPFLCRDYFLSVSRSIEDNHIDKICDVFSQTTENLVLVSNFSHSDFGKSVFIKYKNYKNLYLIDSLYNKDELDLIRLNCYSYVHTHEKCGTAPSLVEMIISNKPILSIDVPANRYTLMNQGRYFDNFNELKFIIESKYNPSKYVPNEKLKNRYFWENIAKQYLDLF